MKNHNTLSVSEHVRFEALFSPGNIGRLELNNRLFMAAMGNSLAESDGKVSPAMLEYYRIRAQGGVAMVITQFTTISPDDIMPYNLCLHDDSFIPGIVELVRTIHEAGAKVCIQLMHPGMLLLLLKSAIKPDQSIKVPCIVPRMEKGKPFKQISIEEIQEYIGYFAAAALRVKNTGADAIELHACHGCLLSTFLSPAVNRRSDIYGGSVENRTRFARQVVEGIKHATGSDFPLIIRINGDDDIEGGVTPDEVVKQAQILQNAGADAVSISSGLEYWTTLMAPSYLTPPGAILPVAEKIKDTLKVPVIAAGKITPGLAEDTVRSGKADFIALGRPLLADPSLPQKIKSGKEEPLKSCLYCNNCLRSSWRSCTVNPALYRESVKPTARSSAAGKKVMIIGAGLAGLQAAVLLKEKGFVVELSEKQSETGGQWRIACKIPGKEGYRSIITRLENNLKQLKVPVHLNTEVSVDSVKSLRPDIAVIATGARPAVPELAGSDKACVIQANDVIEGKAEARGRVTIIGASILAMETAVLLAEKNKEVILVSHSGLGGRRGPDDLITFRGLMKRIIQLRIPLYLNTPHIEIFDEYLSIKSGTEIYSLPSDTVVLASGVQPVDTLAGELKGVAPEIYLIGDCIQPGNAAQATFSAARLASEL